MSFPGQLFLVTPGQCLPIPALQSGPWAQPPTCLPLVPLTPHLLSCPAHFPLLSWAAAQVCSVNPRHTEQFLDVSCFAFNLHPFISPTPKLPPSPKQEYPSLHPRGGYNPTLGQAEPPQSLLPGDRVPFLAPFLSGLGDF